MDEAVLQLCAQVTDEPPGRISLSTPLGDLAPDSLAYAELAVALDERFGIPLADIGEVTEGTDVVAVDASGAERPLEAKGWDHFAAR